MAGGWGHEAAQAKRRRELAAADTYAAEGGLGRDGANVPVGASADGKPRQHIPHQTSDGLIALLVFSTHEETCEVRRGRRRRRPRCEFDP